MRYLNVDCRLVCTIYLHWFKHECLLYTTHINLLYVITPHICSLCVCDVYGISYLRTTVVVVGYAFTFITLSKYNFLVARVYEIILLILCRLSLSSFGWLQHIIHPTDLRICISLPITLHYTYITLLYNTTAACAIIANIDLPTHTWVSIELTL